MVKIKQQINVQVAPIKELTYFKTIYLHLFAGIMAGIVCYLLMPFVQKHGYPNMMALIIASVVVLLPTELGVLLHEQRKTKRKLFGEIIPYIKPLRWWEYVVWILVILLLSGLAYKLMEYVALNNMSLFGWMPSSMILDFGLTPEYPRENLVVTYILYFIFLIIVIPVTEELYFRGYLLPRMPKSLMWSAPIVHGLLFALYHTWTPWLMTVIFIGNLPLVYVVKLKQNIYLGIIAHILLNATDLIVILKYLG